MGLQGWNNTYSVGFSSMDADHRKLVDGMSRLYEAMKQGKSRDVLGPLVSEFSSYAMEHFAREEKFLLENNHPDYAQQKTQHGMFLDKISEFNKRLEAGNTSFATEMLPFLNQWFMNHIMKIDMKYAVK